MFFKPKVIAGIERRFLGIKNGTISLHNTREFSFMVTRMQLNRKVLVVYVVVGHWQDHEALTEITI